MDVDNGSRRVFNRLGRPSSSSSSSAVAPSIDTPPKVCYHWRNGKCNKHPCPYLHSEVPQMNDNGTTAKRSHGFQDGRNASGYQTFTRRKQNPNFSDSNPQMASKWGRGFKAPQKIQDKCCHYWMAGKCAYGDKCKYQHQWFVGDSFSMLTQLAGHEKGINAIAFPMGSDKLYSGSKDETVRVWDCQTGQCVGVVNMGGDIGCMISEGPWIFVGAPNFVKAWNAQTNADLSLSGPVGQVYALVVGNEMLFAGIQDSNILAWRFNAATNSFEPAASLSGHSLAVVSLVVGANRLYSGAMDKTVRVWDLDTLQCVQVLSEHKDVVMSVLCWDQFLISCSLDRTVKVWAATDSGNLEVTYTHNEEHGLLALCGMHDGETKPILACSCNDNVVRLYDLPSFNERGKIFSKEEIRAIQVGPGGLFFTGDGAGDLKVWKWS
ncbi:hypothetical protein Scep_026186 [Stephania cephalantha]|uniref:C3H1-type domain-containing protein n=1 Tax=Stephania cephalantha TaxID=152367 RepID=A0AAP0EMV7_9MAGN